MLSVTNIIIITLNFQLFMSESYFICKLIINSIYLILGSWGKRDPAWNNLKGLWGKRSIQDRISS